MSIQICVTEKEILETPNYYEMGRKIHERMWQAKTDQERLNSVDGSLHTSMDKKGPEESLNRNYGKI